MTKPLAIDLYAGLGGWTEALLAEGYDVIGFDIESHQYGPHRYPGQLVIQDVRTLHGAQFWEAALLVASPPCQKYSYMAMPWKRSKAMAAAIRADTTGKMLADLNCLFDACFRIQAQASLAAGRHIPMIVENVRGAQKWVGRARWNFGSFYLWGDVPALMPVTFKGSKVPGFRFDGSGGSFQSASVAETGGKAPGMNWSDQSKRGQDFTRLAGKEAIKNNGGSWFAIAHNKASGHGRNPDGRLGNSARGAVIGEGRKGAGAGAAWFDGNLCQLPSNSSRRKMASAMIAKIPQPLARHIAAVFRP